MFSTTMASLRPDAVFLSAAPRTEALSRDVAEHGLVDRDLVTGSPASTSPASKPCESCGKREKRYGVGNDGTHCSACRPYGAEYDGAQHKRRKMRPTGELPGSQARGGSQSQPAMDSTTKEPRSRVGNGETARRRFSSTSSSQANQKSWKSVSFRLPYIRRAGLELPAFIRPLSHQIGDKEVAYLSSRGALWLPQANDVQAMVDAYIRCVHPLMPLLDKCNLLRICCLYARQPRDTTEGGDYEKISLLTLNAVFGAACAYLGMADLKRLGYDSHTPARDAFYTRAKLLYDLDSERDPISVQQALTLMTYWVGVPESHRDTWHWLGLAVNMLQAIEIPEKLSHCTTAEVKRVRMLKRLWWSCFIRDSFLALGLRRPPRMKIEEYDMAPLTMDDFDDFQGEWSGAGRGQADPPQSDKETERVLAMVCIQMAKLCLIINRIQSFNATPASVHFPGVGNDPARKCSEVVGDHANAAPPVLSGYAHDLQLWLDHLPEECLCRLAGPNGNVDGLFPGRDARVKVHVILLNMFYCAAVCALHLPKLLQVSYGTGFRSVADDKVRSAVEGLTTMAEALIQGGLIDYLPNATCSTMMPAVAVYLSHIRSESLVERKSVFRSLGICVVILKGLIGKYQSADLTIHLVERSLRQAGVQLDEFYLAVEDGLKSLEPATLSGPFPPSIRLRMTHEASSSSRSRRGAQSHSPSAIPDELSSGIDNCQRSTTEETNTVSYLPGSESIDLSSTINFIPSLATSTTAADLIASSATDQNLEHLSSIGLADNEAEIMSSLSSFMPETLDEEFNLPLIGDYSFEDSYEPFDLDGYRSPFHV
ncbi:hypothetical protein RBB50_012807 [Rhinocladiella similis]